MRGADMELKWSLTKTYFDLPNVDNRWSTSIFRVSTLDTDNKLCVADNECHVDGVNFVGTRSKSFESIEYIDDNKNKYFLLEKIKKLNGQNHNLQK